jgi:hypothetical protein
MSRLAESLAPQMFGGSLQPSDLPRLSNQLKAVRSLMLDGNWRTLSEISVACGIPQQSASARIRDCRKHPLNYEVERRAVPGQSGLFEYRLRGRT